MILWGMKSDSCWEGASDLNLPFSSAKVTPLGTRVRREICLLVGKVGESCV